MEKKIEVSESLLELIATNINKATCMVDLATQHLKTIHKERDSHMTSYQAACVLESADSILLDEMVAIRKLLGITEEE